MQSRGSLQPSRARRPARPHPQPRPPPRPPCYSPAQRIPCVLPTAAPPHGDGSFTWGGLGGRRCSVAALCGRCHGGEARRLGRWAVRTRPPPGAARLFRRLHSERTPKWKERGECGAVGAPPSSVITLVMRALRSAETPKEAGCGKARWGGGGGHAGGTRCEFYMCHTPTVRSARDGACRHSCTHRRMWHQGLQCLPSSCLASRRLLSRRTHSGMTFILCAASSWEIFRCPGSLPRI